MVVSSGYRCTKYNRTIPGAARFSAHSEGIAVDIVDPDHELYDWISDKLDHYNIWIEHKDNTSGWLHIDSRYRPVGRIFRAK